MQQKWETQRKASNHFRLFSLKYGHTMVRDPQRSGWSNMQLVCRSSMVDGTKSQESHCGALIIIVRCRSIKKKACFFISKKSTFEHRRCGNCTPKASPRVLRKLKIFQDQTFSTPNAIAGELQVHLCRQRVDADWNALRQALLQFKCALQIPYEKSFQYIPSYCNLFSL
ncbi:hypothetical protein XU18_5075 [Perkinsela sp. CCAP 1560/4]|nr:hypothetical protein XU18_5075 [Perkinsela sp. CCAP 1560/4]|eukprot:KNH02453.1 hypothetical protein XU18_5075 [Perkinsela sp. CCAP 1560/4]